jgi:hypothetical protein
MQRLFPIVALFALSVTMACGSHPSAAKDGAAAGGSGDVTTRGTGGAIGGEVAAATGGTDTLDAPLGTGGVATIDGPGATGGNGIDGPIDTGGAIGDAPVASGGVGGIDGPGTTADGEADAAGGTTGFGGATWTGGTATLGGTTGSGGTTSAGGADGGGATSISCPALTNPANGLVLVESTTYGATATYVCQVGYGPPLPSTRTCQIDGTWSGSLPTCNLVNCHAPMGIDHGSVSAPTTTYGFVATYSCAAGYTLAGSATRTCQADGSWSGTPPTCSPIDCGPLSNPVYGSVSASATTYGSTATYTCEVGHLLTGGVTRTCQVTGAWSGTPPTCPIQMLTVTVNKVGPGTGTVTSTPANIDCGSTCLGTFAYGTTIFLAAAPDATQLFLGWSSTACAGQGACAFTLTSNTVVSAAFSPPPNIVFATSTKQAAALGGLGGADTLCAQRAQAASLPGTYRAWLSTTTVDAISRLGTASGWVRPDGRPVLNLPTDIAKNKIFYPPRQDEFGTDLGAGQWVMTATGADGKLSTNPKRTTCVDFTSGVADGNNLEVGSSSSSCSTFTDAGVSSCQTAARIYCFGIDRTAQVVVTPTTGRLAFTTTGQWTPGGGIASADALCQSEATAASLPGVYGALLAPLGATAASRFNTSDLPWIRADGIPLTSTASAFFSATLLDVAPNTTANGATYFPNHGLWSGAATMTTAGTSTTTCGDWLSTSGTGVGGLDGDTRVDFLFGMYTSFSCASPYRLLCLQE